MHRGKKCLGGAKLGKGKSTYFSVYNLQKRATNFNFLKIKLVLC